MPLKKLSVVVPTYNERDNVRKLSGLIEKALTGIPHEIIFVDDSTDDTPEILKGLCESDSRIRYEHRTGKNGLSSAVVCGFEISCGDYIAVMDADMQHPPAILRNMYCAMGNHADICVPSRFIMGGDDGGLDIFRKMVSGAARYLGKVLLPCLWKVSDPTGGLFMFRREILTGADIRPVGWKILIEMLAVCRYNKIIEIPDSFGERNAGESKLSGKVTAEYLGQLISLIPRAVKNHADVVRWTPERMNERTTRMDKYILHMGN